MTDTPRKVSLEQVALRLLAEVRQSRYTKASTYRRRFGERMPKNFEAEVAQMEDEVKAIDAITEAINAGKIF